ncbi:hypothetical protein L1887_32552 [Cichorium endivia]|nr:hypothetical protein L1887_32552 [Cichorium endivia]
MIRSCSPLNLDIISQQQSGRLERLPVLETRTMAQFIEYRAPDPYYAPPYGVPPPLSQQYPAAPQPYGRAYGGQPSYDEYREEKKSKHGMGTGLAVGAAAGLLGGLAIAEGVDYVEDEIAEDAADKVEDDLGYDVDNE